MTWAVMRVGKEKIYMDFADVICAISRGDKATDIYTALFPDGITVDHPIENVVNTHVELMAALEEEDEDDECSDDEGEPSDGGSGGELHCASCDAPVSDCGCLWYVDSGVVGLRLVDGDACADGDGEAD